MQSNMGLRHASTLRMWVCMTSCLVQVLHPQVLTLIVMILAVAMTLSQQWSGTFIIWLALGSQAVLGVTNATIMGGVMAMASWLPPPYVQVQQAANTLALTRHCCEGLITLQHGAQGRRTVSGTSADTAVHRHDAGPQCRSRQSLRLKSTGTVIDFRRAQRHTSRHMCFRLPSHVCIPVHIAPSVDCNVYTFLRRACPWAWASAVWAWLPCHSSPYGPPLVLPMCPVQLRWHRPPLPTSQVPLPCWPSALWAICSSSTCPMCSTTPCLLVRQLLDLLLWAQQLSNLSVD